MPTLVYTAAEFIPTVVSLTDNTTTVSTKQSILRGIYVNTTMSAQECLIENGSGNIVMRIPASSAAGSWFPFGDSILGNGIFVNPDNSATGEIAVIWAPATTSG